MKTHSARQSVLTYFLLLLVSSGLSFFLFMRNPWMESDLTTDSYIWYLEFSRSIFQPQSAYYAESVLLPLLAKILGLTKTLKLYKEFCGLLTLCILPIVSIFALRYFQSTIKTIIFIALFGLTFNYFQYYILGFSDPLTILLLVSAIFQRRVLPLFFLLTMAMLSHFSMAVISVAALLGLVISSPIINSSNRKHLVMGIVGAAIAGKLLLVLWYWQFHYQLQGRIDWALGKGYLFFWDRYASNLEGFWLTPGALFLVTYGLIMAYFLALRQFLFVSASIVALGIAYLALFWTVDGLRVFAVIIAAPYVYFLTAFIQSISDLLLPKHIS